MMFSFSVRVVNSRGKPEVGSTAGGVTFPTCAGATSSSSVTAGAGTPGVGFSDGANGAVGTAQAPSKMTPMARINSNFFILI